MLTFFENYFEYQEGEHSAERGKWSDLETKDARLVIVVGLLSSDFSMDLF